MIRIRKPVRLLEWGEGTNTTNQVWTPIGDGRIVRHQKKAGSTTFTIEMNQAFTKKNSKDNTIKIAQQSEGMAANSTRWGEVAMGVVKSVESGGKVVNIEVSAATKIDSRHKVPAWEEAPQG
jgi:hypothetical protein